jgi:hypothetical protein
MFDPGRLHASLLFTLVALLGGLALWSLAAALRGTTLGAHQRAVFWIAELLLLAECLAGGVLWAQGHRPANPAIHLLYGAVASATIPALLWLPGEQPARNTQARLVLACIFLCAIALRALQTGRP